MSKTDTVFFPGKAYEIIVAAPFMTAKNLSDGEREARVALKEGEKRNKGRGYRVLCTLNPDAALFLCDWFNDFQASDSYRALGTAEALSVRTIADRICEFAGECADAKEKRKANGKARSERMLAAKAAKAAALAAETREAHKIDIARLEAKLPEWISAYDKAFEATKKAKTREEIDAAFNKLDRLQATIISASNKIRTLQKV